MTLVIRSYPGDSSGFRFLICRLTSLAQNGLIGKDTWQGVSRSNSMILSEILGGSGINTCSRCLAKLALFHCRSLPSLSPVSLLEELVFVVFRIFFF
jgi:hypothetical protein